MYTFIPYIEAFAITPNDSANLARETRAVSANTGGDLKVTMVDGTTVTFNVAAQTIYHGLRIIKVFQTGTAAAGIIGWV